MPAARHWRIAHIETLGYSDLVLSELALYEGGLRVDADATLSATKPPTSGSLANLVDVEFATLCAWPAADLFLPGFALSWDFGPGQARDITDVAAASPTRNESIHRLSLDYSDDGVEWTPLLKTGWSYWAGPTTISSLVQQFADPHFEKTELLLDGEGPTIVDLSYSPKAVVALGNAKNGATRPKFGAGAIEFDGSGDALSIGSPSDWKFLHDGSTPYTLEGSFAFTSLSSSPGLFGTTSTTAQSGALWYVTSGGQLSFQIYHSVIGSLIVDVVTSAVVVADGLHRHYRLTYDPSLPTNNCKIFLQGVLVGQATKSGATPSSANPLVAMGIGNLHGFADELRIRRHIETAANFTPPAEPFPTSGGEMPEHMDTTPVRPFSPRRIGAFIENELPPFLDVCTPVGSGGHIDLEDGGDFRILGTVRQVALPTNTPLSRRVRLSYQDNGRVIRETFSDAAGNYAFENIRGDRPYVVTAFDHTDIYRAVTADKLVAEPMT